MTTEFDAPTPESVAYSLSQENKAIFQANLPGAEIDTIEGDAIPPDVMESFEATSEDRADIAEYIPASFKGFFGITHPTGGTTFVAQQEYTYSEDNDTERQTYMIDTDERGNIQGRGEIINNITAQGPIFKDKPFVGDTRTRKEYQHQGLGTRRLIMMNALTQMQYGLPLHSSHASTSLEAERIWERLVTSGTAIKYKEGEMDRFMFQPQRR